MHYSHEMVNFMTEVKMCSLTKVNLSGHLWNPVWFYMESIFFKYLPAYK